MGLSSVCFIIFVYFVISVFAFHFRKSSFPKANTNSCRIAHEFHRAVTETCIHAPFVRGTAIDFVLLCRLTQDSGAATKETRKT
jgi:hypothetical protein